MATQNLSRNAQYIIERAFRRLGVLAGTELPSADEYDSALLSLQDMMRSWSLEDVSLHRVVSKNIPLVAGQNMYEFADRILDVRHIQLYSDNNHSIPMTKMSYDDWVRFVPKNETGQPIQWVFDKGQNAIIPSELAGNTTADATRVYVWPAPSSQVVAQNGYIWCNAVVPYHIPEAISDYMDIPQEWYEATVLQLASRLYDEYGGNDSVIPRAETAWQKVLADDQPDNFDLVWECFL